MPYFLHVRGTRKGPVEVNEIKRMVENGTLTLFDQVWDDAGNKWTVIRDFPDIANLFGEAGPGGEFIINVDGKTGGPFPYKMILREIEKGRFQGNHFVWDEAKARWIKARRHPVFESCFVGVTAPDATYHVAKSGVRIGPIPFSEVSRLINAGELTPDDHLWDPDGKRWVSLNETTDFAGFFKVAAVSEAVEPEPVQPTIPAEPTAPREPEVFAREPAPSIPETPAPVEVPPFPEPVAKTEEPTTMGPPPDVVPPPETVPSSAPFPPPTAEPTPTVVTPPPDMGPAVIGPETLVGTVPTSTPVTPAAPGDIIEIPPAPKAPERKTAPEPTPAGVPPAAPAAEVLPEPKPVERPAVERKPVKEKPIVIEREEVKTFEPTRPSPIKRLVAQVIDLGFISVAFLAVLIVMTIAGMNPLAPGPEQETYRATAYIVFGVVALLYFFLRDGFGGASIGKRVMGFKVVHGYDARPANPIHSFVRNLFLLIPILNIAELFMVFTDKDGRRLGDKTLGCTLMYGTEAEYIRDYGLETTR